MKLNTPIGRLRLLALLEGVSYLLFAITMPLKYMMDIREPNFYVGMIHGWLFMLYGVFCIQNIYLYKWGIKTSVIALVASLIPFGTFYADRSIFQNQTEIN